MLSKIGMRPEWTISGKEAVIRTKYAVEQEMCIRDSARVLASAGPAAAAPGTSTAPIKSSTVHSAAVNFFVWYSPLIRFMPTRHHLKYTTFFPC